MSPEKSPRCYMLSASIFYSLQLHLKTTAEKNQHCIWVTHQTSACLLLVYRIDLWNFLNLPMATLWNWASLSSVYWKPTVIRSASGTLNFTWHGDFIWEWFVWIYVYAEDAKPFSYWSFLWSRKPTSLLMSFLCINGLNTYMLIFPEGVHV